MGHAGASFRPIKSELDKQFLCFFLILFVFFYLAIDCQRQWCRCQMHLWKDFDAMGNRFSVIKTTIDLIKIWNSIIKGIILFRHVLGLQLLLLFLFLC